jgi:hypothetical protein
VAREIKSELVSDWLTSTWLRKIGDENISLMAIDEKR